MGGWRRLDLGQPEHPGPRPSPLAPRPSLQGQGAAGPRSAAPAEGSSCEPLRRHPDPHQEGGFGPQLAPSEGSGTVRRPRGRRALPPPALRALSSLSGRHDRKEGAVCAGEGAPRADSAHTPGLLASRARPRSHPPTRTAPRARTLTVPSHPRRGHRLLAQTPGSYPGGADPGRRPASRTRQGGRRCLGEASTGPGRPRACSAPHRNLA